MQTYSVPEPISSAIIPVRSTSAVGFGNRTYSLTGHLHFLILFSNDSTLDALVSSFRLFLSQSCMIPCGAALIPQQAVKIKANFICFGSRCLVKKPLSV